MTCAPIGRAEAVAPTPKICRTSRRLTFGSHPQEDERHEFVVFSELVEAISLFPLLLTREPLVSAFQFAFRRRPSGDRFPAGESNENTAAAGPAARAVPLTNPDLMIAGQSLGRNAR